MTCDVVDLLRKQLNTIGVLQVFHVGHQWLLKLVTIPGYKCFREKCLVASITTWCIFSLHLGILFFVASWLLFKTDLEEEHLIGMGSGSGWNAWGVPPAWGLITLDSKQCLVLGRCQHIIGSSRWASVRFIHSDLLYNLLILLRRGWNESSAVQLRWRSGFRGSEHCRGQKTNSFGVKATTIACMDDWGEYW